MAFRVLLIESEVTIKLKLNNLIVNKGIESEIWIPLDDIFMIVLDNLSTSITIRMLSQIAEKGIGLVICNNEHNPIGFYCSFNNHSRAAKVLKLQIENMTSEFKDVLWKKIIIHKISNQEKVLKKLGFNDEYTNKLREFEENVLIGDSSNREAHAAKVYFNTMMGTTFSRGNDNIIINSGLDFGYTIIRSYLARLCVGYGLNTQIGIHHKNEYNHFNLCDDLIEPVRPIVDLYVYKLMNKEKIFKAEHRHKIINILNHKIKYRNKEMFVCNMLEEYVQQVIAYIMGGDYEIIFPNIDDYEGEGDENEI